MADIFGPLTNLAFGIYDRNQTNKKRRAANKKLSEAEQTANQTYDQIEEMLKQHYSDPTRQEFAEQLREFEPQVPGEVKTFEYGKSVDDFMNPYYDQILNEVVKQTQHTAAGAGLGRGTGAVQNIAKATTERSDELYNTALDAFNSDREFAYKNYADYINNVNDRLNTINEANKTKFELQKAGLDMDSEYMKDLIDLLTDRTSTNLNISSQYA